MLLRSVHCSFCNAAMSDVLASVTSEPDLTRLHGLQAATMIAEKFKLFCSVLFLSRLRGCCSDFLDTAHPMTQLFDPASHTFWRNVKERAVAPVTAFGRNPARWDVWEPAAVPPVPTWCAAALTNRLTVPCCICFTGFCNVTRHCWVH